MGLCFDTGDLEIVIIPDTMEDTESMEPYGNSVRPDVALLARHLPLRPHTSSFKSRTSSDHFRILSKHPPLWNCYYHKEGK